MCDGERGRRREKEKALFLALVPSNSLAIYLFIAFLNGSYEPFCSSQEALPESKSQGEEGLRRKVFCAKCGESLQADEGRGMLVKRVLPLPRLNYQE